MSWGLCLEPLPMASVCGFPVSQNGSQVLKGNESPKRPRQRLPTSYNLVREVPVWHFGSNLSLRSPRFKGNQTVPTTRCEEQHAPTKREGMDDSYIWKPTQNFISSSVFPNEITIIHLCYHCSTVCLIQGIQSEKAKPTISARGKIKPKQQLGAEVPAHLCLALDSGEFPCLLILLQMSAQLRRINLQLLHLHFRISYPLTGQGRETELASLPPGFRSEWNRDRQKWSLLNHRSRKISGSLSMARFSLLSRRHPLECTDQFLLIPALSHTTSVILDQSLSNFLICHMRGIGISEVLEDQD